MPGVGGPGFRRRRQRMGIEDKYNSLNESEKSFVRWHPIAAAEFNVNAETALKDAHFGAATLHNGSGDAFRHCFWSAMNARDEGKDLAKQFGDAHEDWAGNPANERPWTSITTASATKSAARRMELPIGTSLCCAWVPGPRASSFRLTARTA